jgi:hypothetical protein
MQARRDGRVLAADALRVAEFGRHALPVRRVLHLLGSRALAFVSLHHILLLNFVHDIPRLHCQPTATNRLAPQGAEGVGH